MNVILVHWEERASRLWYRQAVANTEVVGAEIDALLKSLVSYGLNVKDVYLVGHSLGAHVAGYAGKRNPMIGRITGKCLAH